MNNPCIQCGKQRIERKTWQEKIGTQVITYTSTVCPDADCQKIVDQAIADKKAKSDKLIKTKADAKLAREKALADSKLAAIAG